MTSLTIYNRVSYSCEMVSRIRWQAEMPAILSGFFAEGTVMNERPLTQGATPLVTVFAIVITLLYIKRSKALQTAYKRTRSGAFFNIDSQ